MTITNTDTLPGVNVSIADGRLRVQRPLPGTKLTILGTTTSVALNELEPVTITNPAGGIRALRHLDGSPSELSMAVAEAVRAGATNIEVVKIATLSGELSSAYLPNSRFDDLEEAYDILRNHDVDVVVPVGAHADETGLSGTSTLGFSRSHGFVRQLGNFCYQATKEENACIGVIGVRPIMKTARDESWTDAPATRAGELFNDPTLAQVKEWVAHLRTETGSDVDHSSETELTGYLAGSEEASYGAISGSYNLWALEETGTAAVDRNGVSVDGGGYVSVTAILGRINTDETQNLANTLSAPSNTSQHLMSAGAVAYGALITRLDPHVSTTNQPINGVIRSRPMSKPLAEKLLRARMVTMVQRAGGLVVQSGLTAAYNGSAYTRSDFTRLTTRRILHAVVDIIRLRSDPFIGKPITGPSLAALQTEVTSGIDNLKPSGAVRSYELLISSTPAQQIAGEADVEVSLVIGFELQKINAYLQLQQPDALSTTVSN